MALWRTIGRLAAILALAAALSAGCDRQSASKPQPDSIRIVSLAPALSRILVDLELADRLVGIGEHDAAAPPGLPVVGTFLDVNTEKLHALQPTHVLMMTGRGGVPESLQDLAESMGFVLVGYPIPLNVADIRAIIADDTAGRGGPVSSAAEPPRPPALGTVLGVVPRAEALSLRMRLQFEALVRATAEAPQPRVLLAFSVSPTVMASGRGTMLDAMLAQVGARNAIAGATTTAPTFDREKLLSNNPDVVVLLLPRSPPLQSLAQDSRLAVFRGLNIGAVRDERIHLISDPLVLLPGSNVPRVAAAMAAAIHPGLAEQIDRIMQGAADAAAGSPPRNHDAD